MNTPENIALARQYGVATVDTSLKLVWQETYKPIFNWYSNGVGEFKIMTKEYHDDLNYYGDYLAFEFVCPAPTTDELIKSIMCDDSLKELLNAVAPYKKGKQFIKFKNQKTSKLVWLDDKIHLAEALALILLSK